MTESKKFQRLKINEYNYKGKGHVDFNNNLVSEGVEDPMGSTHPNKNRYLIEKLKALKRLQNTESMIEDGLTPQLLQYLNRKSSKLRVCKTQQIDPIILDNAPYIYNNILTEQQEQYSCLRKERKLLYPPDAPNVGSGHSAYQLVFRNSNQLLKKKEDLRQQPHFYTSWVPKNLNIPFRLKQTEYEQKNAGVNVFGKGDMHQRNRTDYKIQVTPWKKAAHYI